MLPARLRESLENLKKAAEGLTRFQSRVIIVLVLLIATGAVFYYFRAKPREIKVQGASTQAGERSKLLTVHVAGAVNNPGLYSLKEGSRVADALKKAGGPTPEALLDNVNLAAKVTDGQKILITRAAATQSSPAGGVPGEVSAGENALININTASEAELDKLPGIGPSMAQRIIDYREKKGSFSSVNELDNVEGIGPSKLEGLKDLVTI
jgi:competence protein ComEA